LQSGHVAGELHSKGQLHTCTPLVLVHQVLPMVCHAVGLQMTAFAAAVTGRQGLQRGSSVLPGLIQDSAGFLQHHSVTAYTGMRTVSSCRQRLHVMVSEVAVMDIPYMSPWRALDCDCTSRYQVYCLQLVKAVLVSACLHGRGVLRTRAVLKSLNPSMERACVRGCELIWVQAAAAPAVCTPSW
jgi:hypothetical protein